MTCSRKGWPPRWVECDRSGPTAGWNNQRVAEPSDTRLPGAHVIQADLVGTVAFIVTAGAAAALLRPALQAPAVAVAGALFVGGCLAFAWGFLLAVQRSRTEAIELSSLFFLKDSAPAGVRRALLGLVGAQVVAAIVTASVRPFTSLAFGVIAPVWGLGLITLWSGLHGTFSAKGVNPVRRSDPGQEDPATPSGQPRRSVRRNDSGEGDSTGSHPSSTTAEDRPE